MFFIDFILHIDNYIYSIANTVGLWTYLILFLVIFVETGVVILPFLPGDSLLFAAGALAANPKMHFSVLVFGILFFIAAFVGDTCNFFIGRTAGYRLVHHKFFSQFIKEDNIKDAELYFEKYGSTSIILGRYIPIIRTFVPFVAGLSQFPVSSFIKRSFIAALSWTVIAAGAGYLFGNIPFVKTHFSAIILAIVFVTLLPSAITVVKTSKKKK
ncbi:VTT domain-containing protein [Streptococcus mutans]|jgi:putative membrane-associated protein|uniref:Membrane-associated protein DedA n=2 Tax=Streptococcus mutans TaxID=1309 RepID=Q8DS92_STRMU|nr:VTT domain-containing protein [Streptococcus mutans]AAN59529.1 putative membrane-associated protein DedA [Streptococcus mutans UA159]AJD56126.1 membrane-associated protein DedA [Streptococcus mutans UA159-FR]AMF86514.1 cytochrome O ubiquinol oxidase [Streptococcus mutans]ARS63227.1 cytochrome O ubiquinol oxidase [Streptococcus mutans]EMB59447.1 putative membrane-associated protein [Streptococcus mutans 15JP3]